MEKEDKSTSSPFDSLAKVYDTWFDGEGRLIFNIELEALREAIPALPRPWLEVGVGTGRFALALGIDQGIDPSGEMLRIARERGLTVYADRGEEQFFYSGSFGTVFIILALCFVDSAPVVLGETYRVLYPGGKLVIGFVPRQSSWGRYYQEKKTKGHPLYSHATFYSYGEVEGMLHQAGFSVEKTLSTLFQDPDRVKHTEKARKGFHPGAGFIIIVAGKNNLERG